MYITYRRLKNIVRVMIWKSGHVVAERPAAPRDRHASSIKLPRAPHISTVYCLSLSTFLLTIWCSTRISIKVLPSTELSRTGYKTTNSCSVPPISIPPFLYRKKTEGVCVCITRWSALSPPWRRLKEKKTVGTRHYAFLFYLKSFPSSGFFFSLFLYWNIKAIRVGV